MSYQQTGARRANLSFKADPIDPCGSRCRPRRKASGIKRAERTSGLKDDLQKLRTFGRFFHAPLSFVGLWIKQEGLVKRFAWILFLISVSILSIFADDSMAQVSKAYFGVEYELDPSPKFLFHGMGNRVKWDNIALYAGYFTDKYTSVEAFTNFGEYSDRHYFDKYGYLLPGYEGNWLFATTGIRLNLGSSYDARGVRWYFLLGAEGIFYGSLNRDRTATFSDGITTLSEMWSFPKFKYQGWGITLLGFRLLVPVPYANLSWTSRFTIPLLKSGWDNMPDAQLLSSTIGVRF